MKNTLLFAAMAALLTIASCQKEETPSQDSAKDPVFTATISATKTTVDATNAKVAWVMNDEITVTDNASVSVKYTVTAIDGSGKATFTKKSGETGTLGSGQYTAVYGSAPSTSQTYSTSAPSLPMSGVSGESDTYLKFTVSCGLLEITLTKADESIKTIAVSDGTNTYTLYCGDGVSIASGAKFFIAVPAGTYTSFKFVDTNNKVCEKKGLNIAVTANHIKPISSSTNLIFLPEGALSGVFSVSDDTKVRFSQGNLFCDTTTSPVTYSFEAHQYDFRHYKDWTNDAAVIDGTSTTTPSGTVGSFYWSKTASVAYAEIYPDDSAVLSDVFFTNVTTTTPKSDFTVSGSTGIWRTLSGGAGGEWEWLLGPSESPDPGTNCRTSSTINETANARYAAVKVNSLAGLLLFPDAFTWPSDVTTKPSTFNTFDSNWNNVNYGTDDFAKLETAGCVFLPAAGSRVYIIPSPFNPGPSGNVVKDVYNIGDYWSSTAFSDEVTYACYLHFGTSSFGGFVVGLVSPSDCTSRNSGCSVRLVCDANQ